MSENNTTNIILEIAPKVAKKFKVNKKILANIGFGIVAVESNHKIDATNKYSTARGLFQVLIGTQREVESKHLKVPFAPAMYETKHFPNAPVTTKSNDKILNDPKYSVEVGLTYLAYQLNRYKGDVKKAIHAYNQGSYNGKQEGINYTNKVLSKIKEIFKPTFY